MLLSGDQIQFVGPRRYSTAGRGELSSEVLAGFDSEATLSGSRFTQRDAENTGAQAWTLVESLSR